MENSSSSNNNDMTTPSDTVINTKFGRVTIPIKKVWRDLNIPQKLYVTAILVWLCTFILPFNDTFAKLIIYSIVSIAVMQEAFPILLKIWHSIIGKAFVLFLYAVVTVFALASASSLVNKVAGVSADALPYSHNFAIILTLPSWLLLTTALVFVILQLITPFYLILLLVLKPFGIKRLWHSQDYQYVFTTAVIRYAWMIALFVQISILSDYIGAIGTFSKDLGEDKKISIDVATNGDDEEQGLLSELHALAKEEEAKAQAQTNATKEPETRSNFQKKLAYFFNLERLMAQFIYENEADIQSRCEHPQGTRVVELNDYEILVVSPSDETETGYDFYVEVCQSAAFGKTAFP